MNRLRDLKKGDLVEVTKHLNWAKDIIFEVIAIGKGRLYLKIQPTQQNTDNIYRNKPFAWGESTYRYVLGKDYLLELTIDSENFYGVVKINNTVYPDE